MGWSPCGTTGRLDRAPRGDRRSTSLRAIRVAIDADQCIYLVRGKCKACEKFCPADAIFFDDTPKEKTLNVGGIILAAGSQTVPMQLVSITGGTGRNVIPRQCEALVAAVESIDRR